MQYVHVQERPEILTPEWVTAEYEKLVARIEAADASDGAQLWIELATDWNALKSYVGSEHARLRYTLTKDMANAAAEEAERVQRETIVPVAEGFDAALVAALLASPHREAIGERFGKQLLAVLAICEGPLAPVNSELRVEAGSVSKRYDKLVAAAEVQVAGETLTLARARALASSEDAAVRREAFEAYYGWFVEQRDELAGIYAELVQLRDRMGRNLGFDDFVPLGYAGMERTDYGPAEAQRFRDAVLEYAAPLFKKGCEQHAAALGVATLKPWDLGYHPELNLPSGAAEPIGEQLDKIGRVFEKLSPKLSAHFERMRREELIDLENRKGKAAGAYCTSFPDEGRVAIFCNSTGNEDDIRTLTHEMGHAFQGWESQWIESVDLQWPTSDACEVHSMGMEFLCLPYLGEFFEGDKLATYSRARWNGAINILCYASAIDAFQHWVYEHPEATNDERDAAFVRIRDQFMPGIDWSGDAEPYAASRWYAQLHLFRYPFYYIDYALAETGAMQIGMLDAIDHEGCLETYLELCRLGGTASMTKLFAGAGLRSPFDPATMKDLMAHAAQQLGL